MSFIYNLADTRWSAGGTTYNGFFMNLSNGSGGSAVGAAASRLLQYQNNGTELFSADLNATVRCLTNSAQIIFGTSADTILSRGGAAATWQLGAADAASPTAQTLQAQSVQGGAGNNNVAGATFTIGGSKSTGNANGGALQFAVSLAGSAGATQNALTNIVNIAGTGHMLWNTDNTYDIGANGANRARNLYVAQSITLGNFLNAGQGIVISVWAKLVTSGLSGDVGIQNAGSGQTFYLHVDTNNVMQLGQGDAASAVAQIFQVQNVAAGNGNTAGANWTIRGSLSNGSGASGDIIIQTGDTGAGSGTQNAYQTAITLKAGAASGKSGSVVLGSAALATNATDGFIYIASCAGTPTGTPTAFTGRVALVYDTTNNKIGVYNGAWKQTVALT